MSRIVNRVPTLRKPHTDGTDRLLADIQRYGGFGGWLTVMLPMYGDALFDHTQKVYGDVAADWAIGEFLEPVVSQPKTPTSTVE
ncbi:hypothetical protein [Gordonia rubripertincta]|nr:hypothetical protein [Gordonia rubripertincta]